MDNTSVKSIQLSDYQPPEYDVQAVFLDIDCFDGYTIVKNVMHCQRRPNTETTGMFLNGEGLMLQSISLDDTVLEASEYEVTEAGLTIFDVPKVCVVETVVKIFPEKNHALSGLYRSSGNYVTQCEPHGFRHITYYFDRPDVMSTFTTTVTADKAQFPYLLSNGNLIESTDLEGGRHSMRWEDPSLKSAYLFAVVAGDFDVLEDSYTTMSGRTVALKFYVEKGYLAQSHFAMGALKRAMRWDEERWGREYDLNIYMVVAVSDFNMGAMENKGLNIFNTKYVLVDPKTATDMDYFLTEAVIGHEYFHNWSGNRVTCRDWFQITLKEGLTVFRDQEFSCDMTDRYFARPLEVKVMRDQQFLEDASPMAHPIRPQSYIEVNNFYTLTVYRKGAEVIRMVETLLSPERFREGLDLYFDRHDGQAVTTDDFIQCMEDVSGRDLTQFKRWYDYPGTPVLSVNGHYDSTKKTFTLHVRQSGTEQPMHFPLIISLLEQSGLTVSAALNDEETSLCAELVLEVTDREHDYVFKGIDSKPIPSLLCGFSAPVKVEYDYTNDELVTLAVSDSDDMVQIDASQLLATRVILDKASGRGGDTLTLLHAFTSRLMQNDEPYRKCQVLTLPSLSHLVSQMENPDIQKIHEALESIRSAIGNELADDFHGIYHEMVESLGEYEYVISQVGIRAMKNLILTYLVSADSYQYATLAYDQFKAADNMTDKLAALSILSHVDQPLRESALNEFYEEWKHEPLVMNKWFTIQAGSMLPGTVSTVRSLLSHPGFDIKNPNKVYALLVSFGRNLLHFHAKDGSGYDLIKEQVLVLDAINPQVAARILQPLTHWKMMDNDSQSMMRARLKEIANTSGLSKDVYEIASKSA